MKTTSEMQVGLALLSRYLKTYQNKTDDQELNTVLLVWVICRTARTPVWVKILHDQCSPVSCQAIVFKIQTSDFKRLQVSKQRKQRKCQHTGREGRENVAMFKVQTQ